jgi:hypothetical protein
MKQEVPSWLSVLAITIPDTRMANASGGRQANVHADPVIVRQQATRSEPLAACCAVASTA